MRSYGKMVFLGGLLTREEVDGYYDKCMELARGRGDRDLIANHYLKSTYSHIKKK